MSSESGADKARCCGCSYKVWSGLALVLFVVFLVIGSVAPGVINDKLQEGIREASVITGPNHKGYKSFVNNAHSKDNPPLWKKYWMFNVTNAAEVEQNGAKPLLQEIGPYTYREHRLKLDVEFHRYPHPDRSKAASIEYTDYTYYTFNAEQSCKDCDPYTDKFTVPALSFWTLYSAIKDNPVYQGILGEVLKGYPGPHKAFTTETVDKLLWGFDDPMLVYLGDVLKDLNITIPSRLSLQTNHTSPDHALEDSCRDALDNGHADPNRLKSYDKWHCKTEIVGPYATPEPVFGTDATQVKWGMDCDCGRRDPPYQRLSLNETHPEIPGEWGFYPETKLDRKQWPCRGRIVPIWVDTIERPLPFQCFSDNSRLKGIKVYKYQGALSLLHNAELNPVNANYHQLGPVGLFNMTQMGPKAPIFLSKAHFMDADPSVAAMIDGLAPADPKIHDIWLMIEPHTGATMQAFKRLQPNLHMEPNVILPKISESFCPIAWIEESSELTSKQAREFRDTVYGAMKIRDAAKIGGFTLAALVFAITAVAWYMVKRRQRQQAAAEFDYYEYTTLYDGVYDSSINTVGR